MSDAGNPADRAAFMAWRVWAAGVRDSGPSPEAVAYADALARVMDAYEMLYRRAGVTGPLADSIVRLAQKLLDLGVRPPPS